MTPNEPTAEQMQIARNLMLRAGRSDFQRLIARLIAQRDTAIADAKVLAEECKAAIAAIRKDHEDGGKEVDKALEEFGYDSLRFCDVRHGWLFSTRATLPWHRGPQAQPRPAARLLEKYGKEQA